MSSPFEATREVSQRAYAGHRPVGASRQISYLDTWRAPLQEKAVDGLVGSKSYEKIIKSVGSYILVVLYKLPFLPHSQIIPILHKDVTLCVEAMTPMGSTLNRAVPEGCPYHLGQVSLGKGWVSASLCPRVPSSLPSRPGFYIELVLYLRTRRFNFKEIR